MAIRYDRKLRSEISRTVAAYNRKITMLKKSGRAYQLPQKVTVSSVKEGINARRDMKRRLQDLKAFTKAGGENIIKVNGSELPQYLYSNIKRYQRLLKYQTTKRLRKYETSRPISNGKVEPLTFAQYGEADYLTLRAKKEILLKKDLSRMTKQEAEKYLESLEANTKTKDLKVWQNNYLGMLEDTGLSYGYDTDKLEKITERLSKLSPKQFDELSFYNRNIKDIIFKYKALGDIQTANELQEVGEDVTANLDSLYENLDELLAPYE